MKNSKGISVLALVITVVVIIIITSITVYTGVNMISDAKQKGASDKLKVICNELRKNDNFLEAEEGTFRLSESHLDQLGLAEYYDEKYPIDFSKETVVSSGDYSLVYRLTMYDGENILEPYAEEYFVSAAKLEKNNYKMNFDESKGVNRPILYDDMYALNSDTTSLVNDIYEDNWYDYMSVAPYFAKMQYGSGDANKGIYVWVPRFAYAIQSYYNGVNSPGKPFAEVPNSAIKIVFLKENTNYMSNGEMIPAGYRVHPAFSNTNGEFSGIWVAMNTSEASANLGNAITQSTLIAGDTNKEKSHLMTNSEFSAALYLMYAGNSLEQIDFTKQNEFVAATIKDLSNNLKNVHFCDIYEIDVAAVTGIAEKMGDAMLETNWNRIVGTYPSNTKPCIVRSLKSGYFDFISVMDQVGSYYYRAVIICE